MNIHELLSKQYREAIRDLHDSSMADPVYRDGFQSESAANPYEFDEGLDRERMGISLKDGALTDDEQTRLSEMNTKMDATPWARWSSGHHARLFDFLAAPIAE